MLEFNRSLKFLSALVLLLAITGGGLSSVNLAYAHYHKVESISVNVKTSDSSSPASGERFIKEKSPPARVAKKMALSVEAVGEQLLLGRSVIEVAQNKESYELLIKEIFDRVLSGYSISKVTITALEKTHIDILLIPWTDVVSSISVEIDVGPFSTQAAKLIKADVGDLAAQITDILIGLPVEAVEWAGVMTKEVLRECLSERLPEFRANFDISGDEHTVIKISLIPNGLVVKSVQVTTLSKTIPNVIINSFNPKVKELTESMIGLPAAFLERHQDYFTGEVKKKLDNNPRVKKYALSTSAELIPGVVSEMNLGIETTRYVINIEGYLDIGHSKNNEDTSAMAHLGRKFGYKNQNEAFLEVEFVPSTLSFDFETGIGRNFGRRSLFEIRYNLSESDTKLRLVQQIHPKYSIKIQRCLSQRQNSFSLRYKVHEMMSAEYIITNDEHWLRLIGHL